MSKSENRNKAGLTRYFRRGPWENGATALIALGVFMLMQPFSLWLYGWSFTAILIGTVTFIIVSHFPEGSLSYGERAGVRGLGVSKESLTPSPGALRRPLPPGEVSAGVESTNDPDAGR